MPRRTQVAPARSSPPPPSMSDRWSVRPRAARWPGSAPAPARAPVRSVRIPRSLLGPDGLDRAFALRASETVPGLGLPVTLFLQRVGDVLRHVGLVVLGEHAVGLEQAC